jgi:hypothetical protein
MENILRFRQELFGTAKKVRFYCAGTGKKRIFGCAYTVPGVILCIRLAVRRLKKSKIQELATCVSINKTILHEVWCN